MSGQTVADPRLESWKRILIEVRWAALILDGGWRLAWVSDELKKFLGEWEEGKLGVGSHIVEAFAQEPWLRTVDPEGALNMFNDLMPYLMNDPEAIEAANSLPPPLGELMVSVEPREAAELISSWFTYTPGSYRVNLVGMLLRDDDGDPIGCVMTTTMDASPFMQSLLARGDEAMYGRMAELVEPGSRQAAILFADVEGSGDLSRRMPSASYFELIGDLTTAVDREVAAHEGIVGKHAGDGVSAFFLVNDLGSPSAAAAAAIVTARAVQDAATELSERLLDNHLQLRLRMAVHWGSNLYMGQIVPGGRLDVTALGDEVNECARMQESTPGGRVLVSKSLIELLDADDAKLIGIDVKALVYAPLKELESVTEKAVRDAGGLSVARLES